MSRWSAISARQSPPSAATRRPVSSSSSLVAGATSMLAVTGPATSTPTTAAPSRAKATAVARPMPRAAPVMMATLPARRPLPFHRHVGSRDSVRIAANGRRPVRVAARRASHARSACHTRDVGRLDVEPLMLGDDRQQTLQRVQHRAIDRHGLFRVIVPAEVQVEQRLQGLRVAPRTSFRWESRSTAGSASSAPCASPRLGRVSRSLLQPVRLGSSGNTRPRRSWSANRSRIRSIIGNWSPARCWSRNSYHCTPRSVLSPTEVSARLRLPCR